jgi:carboxypeptidase family protein
MSSCSTCAPRRWALVLAAGLALGLAPPAGARAQGTGTIAGRVLDTSGGVIGDAAVEVAGPARKTARTDAAGAYRIEGLPPGAYTVLITRERFSSFAQGATVTAGGTTTVEATLAVAPLEETAIVESEPPLGLDPDESAGTLVLRDRDLDALPDDPTDLAAALQALAGPAAGLGGGQILVDGFSTGRLPPKTAIREIRFNANPFSAEFERPGFGRVTVLTRRGLERVRGSVGFDFTSDRLSWPSAYVPNEPRYRRRRWAADFAVPLSKSTSLSVDLEHRASENEQVLHATVLDPDLRPRLDRGAVAVPEGWTTISPRLQFQRGRHALSARYSFTDGLHERAGIGGFVLPSAAYRSSYAQHTLQLIETSTPSSRLAVESRIQMVRERSRREGDAFAPVVQVLEAFTGGGAPVGHSWRDQDAVELRSVVTWTPPRHTLRAGLRLRGTRVEDVSDDNFAGTVTFAGGSGPLLDDAGQAVLGADGLPLLVPLTSLERYRRTLLYAAAGLSPAQVRALGGGATQLRLAAGDPRARVTQGDGAAFLQDDWRMTPRLTLSLGLRYENQTNLSSFDNVGPRLAFAWSPRTRDAGPRTVVRGGFGLFYSRIDDDLKLQARRFREGGREQLVVTAPEVLDRIAYDERGVAALPFLDERAGFVVPRATRRLAADLAAPRTAHGSLSLEQMLPGGVTLSVVGVSTRTRRLLRSRNVNAPEPDTGRRPLNRPDAVYEYESSGRFDQQQLILGLNSRGSAVATVFARYSLARARSDTNGAGSFPASSYDLAAEYGPAANDVRHHFTLGGSLRLPWGVRVSPFVIASSGRPFNITTGRDDNGDTLFTDRPAFASDTGRPGVVETAWGLLDPSPLPGQPVIPRNLGRGPGFFVVNVRLSKGVGFGSSAQGDEGASSPPAAARPPSAGEEGSHGEEQRKHRPRARSQGRVNLTLSLDVENVLNRVNPGLPVGNLSSPSFGRSLSSTGRFGVGSDAESAAGSRRIELQARLWF